jgi:hypothetical protein
MAGIASKRLDRFVKNLSAAATVASCFFTQVVNGTCFEGHMFTLMNDVRQELASELLIAALMININSN